MDPSRPIPPQFTQGIVGVNITPTEAQSPMSMAQLRATQPRIEQPSPFVSPPLIMPREIQFDNRPVYAPTVSPTRFIVSQNPNPHVAISTPPMERPDTSVQDSSRKDDDAPEQAPSKEQEAENEAIPVPEEEPEPEPEPLDLSKFDVDVIMRDLNKLTDTSQPPDDSGPSLEETFEHFGETIADILLRQSEIYDTCQLRGTDEGPMVLSTDGIPVDGRKLEAMTQASSKLFENVTRLSERMHEMTDKLPPLYTRYMAYFRNQEMRQGNTVAFSHTAGPEAAVSKHLVRLQNELLSRAQSK